MGGRTAFDAVLFDCDGVLVDSERLSAAVFADMAAGHGLSYGGAEALAFIRGRKVAEWVAEVEERLGRPLPEDFVPRFRDGCSAAFERDLRAVEGVAAVVDRLLALGVPVAVASSAPLAKIRHTLGLAGLLDRFDDRLNSAYEVGSWKPDPGLFLHAAAGLGVDPARCAVVEDSVVGVRAGVAAGMAVFGYACPATEALLRAEGAVVFDDMAALPSLLGLPTGAATAALAS